MTFDAKVPVKLKETQKWFGSIISRPIDEDSQMDPIAPSGRQILEEAPDYICPSLTLRPDQRIQIYNQQYWWRLLNNMQESFPLVTRLFGYRDFNFHLAIPYLLKYPPCHWSLNSLGDLLPRWVEEEYQASDKKLVLDTSRIDVAFSQSFVAPLRQPLQVANLAENGDLTALLDYTLYLQPHLHLFELSSDLFSFRAEFLKKAPEHWVENDFPPLAKEGPYYFILFRNLSHDIAWSDISAAEFGLLRLFQQGSSVGMACEWLENQEQALVEAASQNLHRWFQAWVVRQWLTLEK
jgi:Putative DNA-binding domain